MILRPTINMWKKRVSDFVSKLKIQSMKPKKYSNGGISNVVRIRRTLIGVTVTVAAIYYPMSLIPYSTIVDHIAYHGNGTADAEDVARGIRLSSNPECLKKSIRRGHGKLTMYGIRELEQQCKFEKDRVEILKLL